MKTFVLNRGPYIADGDGSSRRAFTTDVCWIHRVRYHFDLTWASKAGLYKDRSPEL